MCLVFTLITNKLLSTEWQLASSTLRRLAQEVSSFLQSFPRKQASCHPKSKTTAKVTWWESNSTLLLLKSADASNGYDIHTNQIPEKKILAHWLSLYTLNVKEETLCIFFLLYYSFLAELQWGPFYTNGCSPMLLLTWVLAFSTKWRCTYSISTIFTTKNTHYSLQGPTRLFQS